jgi:hypothetical protein
MGALEQKVKSVGITTQETRLALSRLAAGFGHALPVWAEGYTSTGPCEATAAHLAHCATEFHEVPPGEEKLGDILLFRTGRHLSHVGLVIDVGKLAAGFVSVGVAGHLIDPSQDSLRRWRWLPL